MLNILLTISPFFILIAIGYFIRLFVANDKWVEVLNKFGLFLGFPAIVLNSFFKIENGFPAKSSIITYNLIILLSVIFILFFVTKLLKLDKALCNTYVICSFFGNIAYLGFPFVTSLIQGSEGIVCIHIAIYLILVFTIGISILEISKNHGSLNISLLIRNICKNPLLISVFIGFLISYFKIKPPSVIENSIQLIASSATPVVLIALGIFMAKKIEFNKELLHSLSISFIKLILMPAIFVVVFCNFHIGKDFNVSIIESAMPLAITPFALSEIYPLNKHVIAISIFLSTTFSIITLTFLVSMLNL